MLVKKTPIGINKMNEMKSDAEFEAPRITPNR
jgi:hypothetical protein